MYIEELKPGVLRVSASADWPKPYVGVCGSIHGNEPCGADAIQRIASAFEEGSLEPATGTVFLIHANPEANSQGRRHTRGGDDLNRLWDFEFTETLRQEAWGYEHHRVLELKEVLGELDVFLDLHSAGTPTPPFGISNGEASIDDIAKQVGISFLVQSWYGLADKVIIVTGGTSGIGDGCVKHLAELGAKVVASSIQREEGLALDRCRRAEPFVQGHRRPSGEGTVVGMPPRPRRRRRRDT